MDLTKELAEKGYKIADGKVSLVEGWIKGGCLSIQIREMQLLQKELDTLSDLYPQAPMEQMLHSLLLNREARQMTDEEFLRSLGAS